jgi:NAD-dependent dihydropyrimidine dehydrogenase PreA subunit
MEAKEEEAIKQAESQAADSPESMSTASVAAWPRKGEARSGRFARNMALVDFSRCRPERCEDGVCLAAKACRSHLLSQEQPGEAPMTDPTLCRACADCVRACPLKAIAIVTQ